MFAAYLHTIRETIHRRMALVLIGMAALVAYLIFHFVTLVPLSTGDSMVFLGRQAIGPASLAIPAVLAQEVRMTGSLWLFLAIFGSTPLLVSMMEKGWVELTLTKGVSRWQVLLGAYFGGLTLYAATLAMATLPTALWIWAKTGIGVTPLLVAICLQVFGFAALLALAALTSMTRTGVALPIIVAVVADFFSPVLAARSRGLFVFITSDWARGLINWIYRILPKNSEIVGASESYLQFHKLGPSWPFWSTGVFVVVTLGLTMWLLHRKSL
jgi:ABC-type transport system involved in multi-copper enzyme maturation permease subunit